MPYNYQTERPKLFCEDGTRALLFVRDRCARAFIEYGAIMLGKAIASGDVWVSIAAFDYLVELGEIHEVTSGDVAGQHRVFVKAI